MPVDAADLTVERLRETLRILEESCMDAEMAILLSDNGPAKLMLLHGGRLVEVNGQLYVVAREVFGDYLRVPMRAAGREAK